MRKSAVRLVLAAGTAVCVGVLASACGGPATPGVATLSGNSANASHASKQSGSGSGNSKREDSLKYSKCMRAHGVKNFPENPNGPIKIGSGSGIDPNSPTFQKAQQACQSLLPRPTPAKVAQAQKNALKFSKCMRSHGVRNFPDPKFSATGGGISIRIGSGTGSIRPTSPTFQKAQQACSKIAHLPLPKGKPKGG